jgi:flavin reductase (DIM6/NTAB) family NADH-FMN oxidoreductase RutF
MTHHSTPLSSENFCKAMRHLAAGVSIVAAGDDNYRSGITATSVVSLSANPPTLLACINRESSLMAVLARFRFFSVNFLSARQSYIAKRFAGFDGAKGSERFQYGQWSSAETEAPVLLDALASLECEIEEKIERHSHSIVIGAVRAVHTGSEAGALIYWRSRYGRVSALPSSIHFAEAGHSRSAMALGEALASTSIRIINLQD